MKTRLKKTLSRLVLPDVFENILREMFLPKFLHRIDLKRQHNERTSHCIHSYFVPYTGYM